MVHLLLDGEDSNPPLPVEGAPLLTATVTVAAGQHWLRLEVRDPSGADELISSPLHINFPQE